MRASRYPLHLTVFYQSAYDDDWREGQTVNISSSGALIQVDDPLPPGTPIEFRFVLPPVPRATTRGEICGRAHVVRLAAPAASLRWCCGVAIDNYELQPGETGNWLDDL